MRESTLLKVKEVKKLVEAGNQVLASCKKIGINTNQYYSYLKKARSAKPTPSPKVVATAKKAAAATGLTLEQENQILREVVIDLTLELKRAGK